MNKKLVFLLLVFMSLNAQSQTLEQLYDSARNTLNLKLAHEVKDLAIEAQNHNVLGNAYYLIGYIERHDGHYTEALSALLDALIIYRDLNQYKLMIDTQFSLGTIYGTAGLEKIAMKYYQDAISLGREVEYTLGVAEVYHNMGQTLAGLDQYDSAINCFQRSIELHQQLGDDEMIARCYNNIGIAYEEQKQYKKAVNYYSKALKSYNPPYFRAIIFNNLGYLSLNKGDSATAKIHFIEALKIGADKIQERTLALLNQNLGLIYENEHPDSSIFYNEKGLYYLKGKHWVMDLTDQYYDGCKILERLYIKVGNYEKARYYDSLQDALNASLVQLHKDLNQSNIRYQIEAAYKDRLDAKTKALEERNQILMYVIILLGVLFISLIIAFWLYFKYKKRTVFIYDRVQKAYRSLEKKEVGV